MTSPPEPPYYNGHNSIGSNSVLPWKRSFGTPHHFLTNPTNPIIWNCSNDLSLSGTVQNCFVSERSLQQSPLPPFVFEMREWNEGAHQTLSIILPNGNVHLTPIIGNDPFLSYCFDYRFSKFRCYNNENFADSINVVFRIGNNFVDSGETGSSGIVPVAIPNPIVIPPATPPGFQVLRDVLCTNDGGFNGSFAFDPNSDYSQFQVYVKNNRRTFEVETGYISFDSIRIHCNTTALTDITSTMNGMSTCFTAVNANPNSPFLIYSWDFGDGTSSTEVNPCHTYLSSGQFNVCVTITDSNGCCATRCESTESNVCTCPSLPNTLTFNATGGVPLSQFVPTGDIMFNQDIIIKGNLIIDRNFVFSGCNLKMEPGAEITKNGNIDFRLINNTYAHGCEQMWRGINVLGRGVFVMDNARIDNAEYAIRLNPQSNIRLNTSIFENNYVSIYGAPSASLRAVSVEAMTGNTFRAAIIDNNWLPAYPGQVGFIDRRSFAGVYVTNTSIKISGTASAQNQFTGTTRLLNGIVASNSQITASRNTFNISSGTVAMDGTFPVNQAALETLQGTAIFVTRSSTIDLRQNTISSCNRGIVLAMCRFATIAINNNSVQTGGSVQEGIWLYNASNVTATISGNNPVRNFRTGIRLNDLVQTQHLVVSSNIMSNISAPVTGIDIQNVGGTRIYGVTDNTITSVTNGEMMRMNRTNRFLVRNNVLSTSSTVAGITGFRLTSNTANQFRFNSFALPVNNSQTGHQGFRTVGSNSDIYCCNTATAPAFGFSFEGMNNLPNNYIQNRMYDSNRGLNIPSGGSIGLQRHMGNTWSNLNGGGQTNATNNSDPGASQFFVNPNQNATTSGVFYRPQVISPNVWFTNETSTTAPTCATRPNCGRTIYTIPDIKVPDTLVVDTTGGSIVTSDPDKLNSMLNVAQGIVLNNAFYAQNLWKAQFDLLNELISNPSLLPLDPILANFYNQNTNTDLRKVVDFDRSEKTLFKYYPSERITWMQLQDSIMWYSKEIDNVIEADPNQPNYTLIDAYQVRIVTLSGQLSSLVATVNSRGLNTASTLLNTVNNFSTALPWVQKKKFIMAERLGYLIYGKNSISIADSTTIASYANSCYLENGSSVHEAQALLDLYSGQSSVWVDSCATVSTPRYKSTQVMNIKLFPNPASSTLAITTPIGVEGAMEIIDSRGLNVAKILISPDNDRYTIDITEWSSGIYFIKTSIQDEPIIVNKFIKI